MGATVAFGAGTGASWLELTKTQDAVAWLTVDKLYIKVEAIVGLEELKQDSGTVVIPDGASEAVTSLATVAPTPEGVSKMDAPEPA